MYLRFLPYSHFREWQPYPFSYQARIITLHCTFASTLLGISLLSLRFLYVTVFYVSPDFATAVFVAASATDWLDGYLARKVRLLEN